MASRKEMGLVFDLETVGERYGLGCVCRLSWSEFGFVELRKTLI